MAQQKSNISPMKNANNSNEQIVTIKECENGFLSISIENEDYIVYDAKSDTTVRFHSLRVANEFYETEVN